jgi:regulator of CtrA degradation
MLRSWKASVMSQLKSQPQLVSFAERLAGSSKFDRLFADGMALVERTAAYLDTDGRTEAKRLQGAASVAYATESMRLTTRLLELASWLIVRRSLKNGEITPEEAAAKRARLKIGGGSRPSHNAQFETLPATLRALVEESFQLTDRVLQLERAIDAPAGTAKVGAQDPVGEQRARLETAFGRPRLVVSN